MEMQFLLKDVKNLLQLKKHSTAINYHEKEGNIPQSARKKYGQLTARTWDYKGFLEIAKFFGKIKKPQGPKVICTYIPKGGVGKTTWTINFAKTLAYHALNVLIIPLDFQCSLGNFFLEDTNEDDVPLSLQDVLIENVPIENVIQKTKFSNLHIIPETPYYTVLDAKLNHMHNRDYRLKNEIDKIKTNYDVILFDCSPNYNMIVTNALVASDYIVSTINPDTECYQSLEIFFSLIENFETEFGKSFVDTILIPNEVDTRSSFPVKMLAKMQEDFTGAMIPQYIRRAAAVQESIAERKSILEYMPKSEVAGDYYEAILKTWERINGSEEIK